MDFRAHAGADLGGVGEGEIGLETGSVFSCDRCKKPIKILAIEKVIVIKVLPIMPRTQPVVRRR